MKYYVRGSGSDSNPGTLERPWRTVERALRSMGHGDEVLVAEATEHVERASATKHPTFRRLAEELRAALLGVKGECWCEHGVGHPLVSGHSAACVRAHEIIEESEGWLG